MNSCVSEDMVVFFLLKYSDFSTWARGLLLRIYELFQIITRYRFSAFWLRSKCSICSYQLNIWYVPYMGTTILNWFLVRGEMSGACSALATGWPGIAVPPGSAHSPRGEKSNNSRISSLTFPYLSLSLSLYFSLSHSASLNFFYSVPSLSSFSYSFCIFMYFHEDFFFFHSVPLCW